MWATTSLVPKTGTAIDVGGNCCVKRWRCGLVGLLGTNSLLFGGVCTRLHIQSFPGMKKDKLLSVVPKRVTNKRRTPFTYTDTRNNTFHFRYKLAIERIGSKISHGQSRPWPQIRDRCNGSLADYVINIASTMMTPSLGSGSAGVTCCIGGARARYRPPCFLE